jgi:molybdopterin biosynthesis enzyme
VLKTTGKGDRCFRETHLWQIAIKPGRPMSFGQIGDCVILGLPGNPVAVFVCFLIYVRLVLARLAGGAWPGSLSFACGLCPEKEAWSA